jgi:hypothetical protein
LEVWHNRFCPISKEAFVADPNNFFLTPFAPCIGCAPTIAAPER